MTAIFKKQSLIFYNKEGKGQTMKKQTMLILSLLLLAALAWGGTQMIRAREVKTEVPADTPISGERAASSETNDGKPAAAAFSPYRTIVVNSLLLGGIKEGQWVENGELFPLLNSTDIYRVYEDGVFSGIKEGKKVEERTDEGGFLGNTIYFSEYGSDALSDKKIVAVSDSRDLFTRKVTALDVNNRVYVDDLEVFLKTEPFRNLGTKYLTITDILKFDIDGDGTDEVLVSASSEGNTDKDNCMGSITYMRKIVGGKVKHIVLSNGLHAAAEEYAPQKAEFTTPLAVCDLNGDGKLEVVTQTLGADSWDVRVHEFNNNAFKVVLSNGAGA